MSVGIRHGRSPLFLMEMTLENDADLQLLKAGVGRIERDVDRLDRKLDSFLTQHQQKHDQEQAATSAHLLQASESMGRSNRHEAILPDLDRRLETIETWRHELLGAMSLMKLAFGTSIVSSIVAVVSLVILLTGR